MTRDIFTTGWSYRPKVSAFMELGGSATSGWTDVLLPHDALIGVERRADVPRGETSGYFPGGAFEYRKTFHATAEMRGKQILLEFDGVYRDAAVFVNGNLAGQRAFGYSRFFVQIDPYLRFGSDNEIRVECRTHLDSRWYSGAGIYRDVHLLVKDPVHIGTDGVIVTTPEIEPDRAVVEVAVEIENSSVLTTTLVLNAEVNGPDGATVATSRSPISLLPGTRGTVRLRTYVAQPELWSVDAPNLHSVQLVLAEGDTVIDERSAVFGIRSLQLDPQRGLRINGETVKLRGACIHSDNGPLGAVSMRAAEERKVARLKEAGFNAIRSAHNPMSTALLEACDKLGMLVMDETFDMWTQSKSDFDYAFDFPEWWERDVEAMVARDINHPSVIFYSIGNEIPETGTPIGSTWGRRLAEKVRSLDSTRYVTNGINGFVSMIDTIVPQMQARRDAAADAPEGGVNTMMAGFGQMMSHIQTSEAATQRTEESYAVLDVAGMNYAEARYELDRDLFPDRIIVGTETWPTSIVGNWELVKHNGHVIGDFTWTGWDYLGETGIGATRYSDSGQSGFSGGFPELTAWCGDIDIVGNRRPVSYFREIVFGLRSDPFIAVHPPANHGRPIAVATPWAWGDAIASWTWGDFENHPVTVDVYSDAEEIELLLDGVTVGRAQVESFRVAIETTYRRGTLTAVAYVEGVETGRFELSTAGTTLVLDARADRRHLRTDGTDLGYVDFTLTDENGIARNGVDRLVTVTVDGPATLQALGSGNPVTTEPFYSSAHTTFEGRALAIVRPTGAGEITVTAIADGCEPAVTTLSAS
ncbi:glycoside hydrolase [Leifsonia sp. Leaf325]|nr:glycoside hydrolase family 2 TIM barrel-domain containing protein [Leifsonia sp. Leaf325]KQQ94218.1 glycoside hydrolase [Leifsonia sp. Leaf325]